MDNIPRLEHYDVDHLIAEGGTAKVYWGIDLRSGYPVAIKELKLRHMGNAVIREKFKGMETQLMLYARHPNIPRLVDFIDLGERGMFLVMEYVEGRSLEQYIYEEIGLIPERRALPIFLEVLETVGFLHSLKIPHMGIRDGVLHLDIKSNNVMLMPNGKTKLIDLGIASRMGDAKSTGYGTPAYMPPEQWGGGRVGKQTDVFALGVMLFEMLTGRLPFESDNPDPRKQRQEIREKIANMPTPKMYEIYPMVGLGLQQVVERALEKEPRRRYASCEEFAERIRGYMRTRKH